jgi:hypothetical protein
MTTSQTYTLIERDFYGRVQNTVTGLDARSADTTAKVLSNGTAYQGEQPWSCEVISEAELLAAVVDDWLSKEDQYLASSSQLVACLREVASRIEAVGERDLGRTQLDISIHVMGVYGATAQTSLIDVMARAVDREASWSDSANGAGHYETDGPRSVRMVTIVAEKRAELERAAAQALDSQTGGSV